MINHSMSPNLNYAPSPNSATPVLYLANLAPDCTEDDIIHALSQFGNVLRVVLLSKRNEAFVQMLSAEQVRRRRLSRYDFDFQMYLVLFQAVYAVKRCSSFGGCQVRGKMASVHFRCVSYVFFCHWIKFLTLRAITTVTAKSCWPCRRTSVRVANQTICQAAFYCVPSPTFATLSLRYAIFFSTFQTFFDVCSCMFLIFFQDHVQNAFSEFGPLARMVFFEKRRTGPQGFVEFQFVEDAIRAQAILDGKV
jgi:hypothetical protein